MLCNFSFFFFSKTFHQRFIMEPSLRGIKDKIESNSFPLDTEKTVRNFFPWSNLANKQWKFVLFVVHVPRVCRDIASIWRLFFSFIATAGTWETRANRKVAETPRFFFTPCWKSTNIPAPRVQFVRNGYPRFTLHRVILLHISDIQDIR